MEAGKIGGINMNKWIKYFFVFLIGVIFGYYWCFKALTQLGG